MSRSLIVLSAIAVVAAGGIAIGAATRCGSRAGAGASATGASAGQFDAQMSGVCQFACATRESYEAGDVHAQPGAREGDLTRCPVSGVVFAVDEGRPHVQIAAAEYITCCDQCAEKLRREPRRYLGT